MAGLLNAVEALRGSPSLHLDLTRLLGGATNQVIQGWRSQIAADHKVAPQFVAEAMSRVIGDSNLSFVTARDLGALAGGDGSRRGIEEAVASYTAGIGKMLRESMSDALRPVALLATNALLRQIEASDEGHRRALEALWRLGWWVPPSAPMSWLGRVGRLAEQGDRIGVRHAMAEVAASPWMRRTVGEWMTLDVFRERRRFIMDGLKDHRDRRYRVSIPTLLPHIEGIAMDAFAPRSATSLRGAIATAAATATAMGPAVVETVTVLWASRTFSDVPAGSRQLNRHLILHGRSTGYATHENSVKTLFALDLLASLVEEAEDRGCASPVPRD